MVTFTAHLSVTIKRLTRYKQKVVLAANTGHATLLKNQSAIKCVLNAFPLKFRVQDTFYVLCQFLASARFQLTV